MIRQPFTSVNEMHNKIMTNEPIDDCVKVWVDKSLISNENDSSNNDATIQDNNDEHISSSKKVQQGFEAQLGRDERINQLQVAIDSDKIKKFEDAVKMLKVSSSTVDSYLKELGYALYDTNKRMHGVNRMYATKSNGKSKKGKFEYYDKDPSEKDAREISREEHFNKVRSIKIRGFANE